MNTFISCIFCYVCVNAYNTINYYKMTKVFFMLPKNFNSPPFISIGRETLFLGKNEIQALS